VYVYCSQLEGESIIDGLNSHMPRTL